MLNDHPYTYVFVRQDIPIEQQLVQASHACQISGMEFGKPEKTPSIVMIGVKDQAELLDVSERLNRHEISHHAFYEPDFGPMGYSALATCPLLTKKERRVFNKYKLYKFQGEQA